MKSTVHTPSPASECPGGDGWGREAPGCANRSGGGFDYARAQGGPVIVIVITTICPMMATGFPLVCMSVQFPPSTTRAIGSLSPMDHQRVRGTTSEQYPADRVTGTTSIATCMVTGLCATDRVSVYATHMSDGCP